MAEYNDNQSDELLDDNTDVLKPRPIRDDTEMDITPMIDITFLLLIFFLVCSTSSSSTGIELPDARFGEGISAKQSIIIKAMSQGANQDCLVILPNGERITNAEDQTARIPEYIENAKQDNEGKSQVMLMGAKNIKAKDLKRISTAVGQVEGIKLYLGVENVAK